MKTQNSKKVKTIHSSRTLMFAELEKVMDYSSDSGNFIEALGQNITGKKSSSGVEKTANYLKHLYRFDLEYPPFKALNYFWHLADVNEKPLLAFVYAVTEDDLLAESIEAVQKVKPGEKASIELFEEVIEKNHPNKYSPKTKRSLAQNIASSWKQAGFVEGKVKNIRVQPEIKFRVACFAYVLAYLNGDRGDFIWGNIGVKALCVPEARLRELATECALKDLMQYQSAGGVTAIGFSTLLNKIGIHGDKN